MNEKIDKALACVVWAGAAVAVAIILISAVLNGNRPSPTVIIDTIEITPNGTTNESEFLLYAYRKLRGEIPVTIYNRDQAKNQMTELRNRVNRYHEYVKERGIDPKIQSLYSDLLTFGGWPTCRSRNRMR